MRKLVGSLFFLSTAYCPLPTALAQNECDPQLLPGAPETVTCDPNDAYPDGITYSSDGDLTLEVAPNDPVNLNVNEPGVNVTGNGADAVSWESSGFTAGNITGTGIVLDYQSSSGAIDIHTGGNVVGSGGATHGIQAVSGSGDVTIQTDSDVTFSGSTASFPRFGIQAEAGGTGNVIITAAGAVDTRTTFGVTDAAAIHASTTGTGDIFIDIAAGTGDILGKDSTAILADSGGDLTVDVASERTVRANSSNTTLVTTDLDLTAAGTTTVTNAGSIGQAGFSSIQSITPKNVAIRAAGGALSLINDGTIHGRLDFSGLTEGYVFNNNAGAIWQSRGDVSNLGAGEINNASTIEFLGSRVGLTGNRGLQPSQFRMIAAPGATFTGLGDSLLRTEALSNGTGQAACSSPAVAHCLNLSGGATAGQTAIRVDISAESFGGNLAAPTAPNPGIVLVDVNGGSSAAGHFVLDPGSVALIDNDGDTFVDEEVSIYAEDPIYGSVIDVGGLMDYALLYNAGTQQHLLASVPGPEAVEYGTLVHEALSIWHTTGDAVAGRQADLRNSRSGKGWWLRAVNDETERDAAPTFSTHGNDFTYDRSYSLSTRSLIAGLDLLAEDDRLIGFHFGVVNAKLEFDDSPAYDRTKGATFGAYGSWGGDSGLTLDGTFNANLLNLDRSVRDFDDTIVPALDNTDVNTDINIMSYGLRGEAGWRMAMSDSFYLQPLATAAYVTADIKDKELKDRNNLSFENAESTRAALGVRLGGDAALNRGRVGNLGWWLTARAWEEFTDDGHVLFEVQGGDDLAIRDDLSGSFEEVGFGIAATNREENLRVYLSGGAKFADDADNYNLSIGARVNW